MKGIFEIQTAFTTDAFQFLRQDYKTLDATEPLDNVVWLFVAYGQKKTVL